MMRVWNEITFIHLFHTSMWFKETNNLDLAILYGECSDAQVFEEGNKSVQMSVRATQSDMLL